MNTRHVLTGLALVLAALASGCGHTANRCCSPGPTVSNAVPIVAPTPVVPVAPAPCCNGAPPVPTQQFSSPVVMPNHQYNR